MKQTEKTLKALANRRRLAIVRYLHQYHKAAVGDIAKEIKLSFKATSKHLGILRTADIVDREQINLSMFYSLNRPFGRVLKSVLDIL